MTENLVRLDHVVLSMWYVTSTDAEAAAETIAPVSHFFLSLRSLVITRRVTSRRVSMAVRMASRDNDTMTSF